MAGVFVPQMQQRDTLGEVLKGLQVASTGFGIYKDFQGLQDRKDQMDLQKQAGDTAQLKAQDEIARKGAEDAGKAKVAGGYLDVPGQAKLKQDGWRESTAAAPGAVPFTMATPQGEKPTFFLPPQNDQEKTLAAAPGKAAEATAKSKDKALEEHGKTFKMSLDLRDRYDKDPTTQLSRGRMNAFAAIEGNALAEQHSGASDMSMIFQFIKMLDPGSTVREGEAASAKNTTMVPEQIMNLWNQKIKDGTSLDASQRMNFYKEAKNLLGSQLKQQEMVDKRYESDATKYEIHDTSMVVDPTFKEAFAEIKKSKPTAVSKKAPGFSVEEKAHAGTDAPFDPDSYLQGVR